MNNRQLPILVVLFLCILQTIVFAEKQVQQCPGYSLSNLQSTKYGYSAQLIMNTPGPYGNDLPVLNLFVIFHTQQIIQVMIKDTHGERWQPPAISKLNFPTKKPSLIDYNIQFSQSSFGFSIKRVSNGDVLFNTTAPLDCSTNGLIFSDRYLELTTTFQETNPNIYGLGERAAPLRLQNNFTYTIWNKDQPTPENLNVYGSHPFYMQLMDNGNANGVFFLNSNAMDIVMRPNSLTYKVTGGILDFFFMMGPSPVDVTRQYTEIIGTTAMPSYWSLGWHQCRWGYKSVNESKEVALNYAKYGIPLETMWNDIDYMNKFEDFTLDPVNYPASEMTAYVDWLHSNNQHYIMIIDPGIHINDTYEPYNDLISVYGTPATGVVWPGDVIFPDFGNMKTYYFWRTQLQNFHNIVPFDGVWIDMNEISNFCNGDCSEENENGNTGPVDNYDPNYPPYLPGGFPLDTKTINMSSVVFFNTSVYNSHSLYGYSEGYATSLIVELMLQKRPTVISRSTFAGSGSNHAHWLGDNQSTYRSMYLSIPGILNMNMFGVGLVGADICGLIGNTTLDLCARWIQLGNFYPFSRSHNNNDTISQEPYVFGPQVINITINAINLKYSLLPYYYTLFYISHAQGDPIVRPLFFEYPTDTNTYALDTQFLVGTSILVSPVLTENATTVDAYFPVDVWYDYFNGSLLQSVGQVQTLDAPLDVINVHLRGGAIIPTQPTRQYVPPEGSIPVTTHIARTLPFTLTVALAANNSAYGQLFLDDGISISTYQQGQYSLLEFQAQPSSSSSISLQSSVLVNRYDISSLFINRVVVYGAAKTSQVTVNNKSYNSFSYSTLTQSLSIDNLQLPLDNYFNIEWSS
ncbi:alpha-glucosidase [Heterostelium album PN500]|uniref:Maltase n=1 Tax=Heterostelium pallidum (strain ATCC 26659 / Pp 5 / PN500) TaxID=670386 RepID=D3BIK6_HETP5|nr:alpha-glucosidase [Heterostelium album PN500]EFA78630.1 alpha-glucosidase [Heterostelium album PN500]|eukprot:XP_020430754.1 alpha-glucosidase [Heterostelium album PN500]